MRNSIKFLLLAGILPLLFLTSCKDDDPGPAPELSEFEKLTDYMLQQDLDLPQVLNGWVIPASNLELAADNSVVGYTVIDIRSEEAFDAGHIRGAINAPLANVLEVAANEGADKNFLLVCYTGQTAARATAALRLMNYNAKSLKWGMAGWNEDFAGPWDSATQNGNGDLNHQNWLRTGDPAALAEFNLPAIKTGGSTGETILQARVRAMLQNTNWIIANPDVLDNPDNYFINNKWSMNSWTEFGHIRNAYRIDEDLKIANLNNLDAAKTMITYCYTGQTSAITTAWLQVLGYDNARSLKFGANAINYTALKNGSAAAKTWRGEGSSSGNTNNFGYVDSDGNEHGGPN